MCVARILRTKGHGVLKTFPHVSLATVVDVLAAEIVGALVVIDDKGSLVGIISERDIVRAIAFGGSKALDQSVAEHMTTKVVTAGVDRSVVDVFKSMNAGRFRHMPIVEEGRLIGIVSSGDAIKYRLDQLETEQSALREYIATA